MPYLFCCSPAALLCLWVGAFCSCLVCVGSCLSTNLLVEEEEEEEEEKKAIERYYILAIQSCALKPTSDLMNNEPARHTVFL